VPTPKRLNDRHPDFAAFAVKIGRAVGRELETVDALQQAEQDKSAFCIENAAIGAALLSALQFGPLQGTAQDLLLKIQDADPDLKDKMSAKSLGKQLAVLWPHLEKVFNAQRKTARGRKNLYTLSIRNGECGEFQTPFS
jgi:hypothetical protein